MEKEEGVMVKGRAIIDTRPPFRSVKEAVALFGERVLVGEIYAKQLKEIQPQTSSDKKNVTSALGTTTTTTVSVELEETRQNLKKAREEGNYMANCLKSLRDELEQTKRELRQLKVAKDHVIIEHPKPKPKVIINPEIEELKFVEINPMSSSSSNKDTDNYQQQQQQQQHEFQKKKFVSFASPPSLTREIKHSQTDDHLGAAAARLGRTPSFRKEGKKKPLVPIMGWLFPKKKRNYEAGDQSPKA